MEEGKRKYWKDKQQTKILLKDKQIRAEWENTNLNEKFLIIFWKTFIYI